MGFSFQAPRNWDPTLPSAIPACPNGLKELDPVSKWVDGVEASVARNLSILLRLNAGLVEPLAQAIQVVSQECRMTTARRNLRLHAAMELLAATSKPHATTVAQAGGFDDLHQAQQRSIEVARLGLAPGGDGYLHVVQSRDPHVASLRLSA